MESFFAPEQRSAQELQAALTQIDHEQVIGHAQLSERLMQQRAAIGRLKSMRAALSDLAWGVEELEQRLRDLQALREAPHDPLVEREVSSMIGRRAQLDELLLAQMLEADDLAASIAAEEHALTAAQSAWSARAAALAAERAQVADLLARIATSGK